MKSTEEINVERFDAYLKKVFGNEVKSYYIRLSKQREKHVIFSNMSISEEKELVHNDVYEVETFSEKVSTRLFDVVLNDELLYNALRAIPKKQREIIILKYWGEMTESEIGDLIGMSQQSVSYNKNKVLKKLKKNIEEVKKHDKRT